MIKVITSKENKQIKFALSLKENKYRKINKMFLAETYKSLEMALKNNVVVCTFSLCQIEGINDEIDQYIVSEEILKKLSSNVSPEGVVFIAKEVEIAPKKEEKILYLDHISDPGNMGTLIRTALAFDYDLVVVSENSVSIYNEKVINSSKGAIFAMPIKVGDLTPYLSTHQIIVSLLSDDSISLDELKVNDKFVLILGNESHGVKRESKRSATVKVKIPIKNIDSLNVAVAGGILMNKIH
ncbi:MAG: RNA methyltransferase [Bacilli bacterium]|nr:RNA methyltransferase [Bacilli bacterium]